MPILKRVQHINDRITSNFINCNILPFLDYDKVVPIENKSTHGDHNSLKALFFPIRLFLLFGTLLFNCKKINIVIYSLFLCN